MDDRKHVLIPIDFLPASRYAVCAVKKLSFSSAQITLLHVYNPMPSSPYLMIKGSPVQHMIFTSTERRLSKSLLVVRQTELDSVENVKIELEYTALLSVASAICQYAESKSVDRIVLTTAKRTMSSRVLLGSVAEGVFRHSPFPVLVVRADSRLCIVDDREEGFGHDANVPCNGTDWCTNGLRAERGSRSFVLRRV